MVKRWVNEAQEAASSDNIMVQVRRMLKTRGTPHTAFIHSPQVLMASGQDRLSSFCPWEWGDGGLGEAVRAAHGVCERVSYRMLLK